MKLVFDSFHKHTDKLAQRLSKNQALSLTAAATFTFVAWKVYKRISNKSTVDPALLPPLVKGGIPLVGNLLQLDKNPAKFIDDAKDTYGPCFSINIPGQGRLVVVTGPLIQEVMKQTKNFNFTKGIETIVPAAKVVETSYNHKFVSETVSPRAKHPSKFFLTTLDFSFKLNLFYSYLSC